MSKRAPVRKTAYRKLASSSAPGVLATLIREQPRRTRTIMEVRDEDDWSLRDHRHARRRRHGDRVFSARFETESVRRVENDPRVAVGSQPPANGCAAKRAPPPASAIQISVSSTTSARTTAISISPWSFSRESHWPRASRAGPFHSTKRSRSRWRHSRRWVRCTRPGVMHRDLKPSNIFLTPHGVKLLDFGLARTTQQEEVETRLTMAGTVLGTPQYLAPEQISGKPVDARADLFAAGSVLYEMLTGRPAFPGASLPEIVHAIVYRAAAGARRVARGCRSRSRDPQGDREAAARPLRVRNRNGGRSAGNEVDRRHRNDYVGQADDSADRPAVPGASPGSGHRLSCIQPVGCADHVVVGSGFARGAIESGGVAVRRRECRSGRGRDQSGCRCGAHWNTAPR